MVVVGGGGGLSSVRAQHPNIPLIVNTYGWLHDMCSVYVVVVWRGGGGGEGELSESTAS